MLCFLMVVVLSSNVVKIREELLLQDNHENIHPGVTVT